MDVTTILAMGFVCLACFLTGVKVGQAVTKGEDVTLPSINPVEAVRKHQARKEAKAEQDRMSVILQNIDNYDGTSRGQQNVPGR
jgi:hypothetical protein